VFRFKEILPQFRPDRFEDETEVADERVIAQYGMALLQYIAHAEGDTSSNGMKAHHQLIR